MPKVALFLALFSAVVPAALAQTPPYVDVPATAEWFDSGIVLLPGDRLQFRPTGEWTNGGDTPRFVGSDGFGSPYPGTLLAEAPLAAVIGRVGNGVFAVRPGVALTVGDSGRLAFAMNDVSGTFEDNRGSMRVYLSAQLRPAPMQDFVGRPLQQARDWLANYRLEPTIRLGDSEHPEGYVYAQTPAPGVDLHGALPVELYVALAVVPVAVPDVVGYPEDKAAQALRDARLRPLRSGEESSTLARGLVTRTEPLAKTPLKRDATVSYWLASGGNVVPDVIGKAPEIGEHLVREAGFADLQFVAVESSESAGVITDQKPQPNTIAELSTQITLQFGITPATIVRPSNGGRNGPAPILPWVLFGTLVAGVGYAAWRIWNRRPVPPSATPTVTSRLDPATRTTLQSPAIPVEANLGIHIRITGGTTVFSQPATIRQREVKNE